MSVVQSVAPNDDQEQTIGELFRLFNDQGHSDYVVVYLRLITSGELQNNVNFYQGFIDGQLSMEDFRRQEVEPMYKEVDHIHVIGEYKTVTANTMLKTLFVKNIMFSFVSASIAALCKALKVRIRVVYMDRGLGGAVITEDKDTDKLKCHEHNFPDEESTEDPKLYLLYRPGHYDILYPH